MFKFFRKIRQRLLTENKFKNYMVYAVGEIVLVVIGIVIALQLNLWKESRQDQGAERQFYIEILDDLKSEYNNLEFHVSRSESIAKLHFHVYNEILGKTQSDPDKYYNYLLWFHSYNMFLKEKYSESLSNITNNEIHHKLKSYIKLENNTNNAVEEWNEHQLQYVRPYLTKHGINNTDAMFNEQLDDFAPIINTTHLINYPKLTEQYGSDELDQLLFNIRFKTLWMAQNFKWLQETNREFQILLSYEMSLLKLKGKYEPVEPKTIREMRLVDMPNEDISKILLHEVENDTTYNFTEEEINEFGYDLMGEEKFDEALKLFKLNIELYPNEWNTYDSYGECLLELGDIENGIKAYKKSLELNPDNSFAKEAIKNNKTH